MTHTADETAASTPTKRTHWRSPRRMAGFALVLAAGVLYTLTLDNGLQPGELHGGDLITHQYAQVQARPSNAPGYPLYTMGGWLWFHGIRGALGVIGVEHPNPIPILSAYSTLWALLALWLLYEVICMVTERPLIEPANGDAVSTNSNLTQPADGNWPVALVVSAFYAVTYFFWYYATTTEQYSSAIAHTLAILWVFLLWLRQRDNLSLLCTLAFLCGLSLAHMLTVAFIVPPIVVAALWHKPDLLRNPKAIACSVTAAALPLVSYAFVYVRGSRHPEWWGSQEFASASDWFWRFVSTAQGREELMWAFEPGRPFLGNGFPALVGQELTWIVVLAGLLGMAFLQRSLRFVLYGTLALYLLFSWAYRFGNWFQVILPAYALLMIGVGAAADRWQAFAIARLHPNQAWSGRSYVAAAAYAAPLLLLGVAIVWRFDASLSAADSRNRPGDTALARAALLLDGPLPEGAQLFASVDDALALQYLTDIWGVRPDISVVSGDQARDRIAQQPVFATWEAAPTLRQELGSNSEVATTVVSPDWVVLSVDGAPPEFADAAAPTGSFEELGRKVVPGLSLSGYALALAPDATPIATMPPAVDVTLYWQIPVTGWPEDLAISVRPTLDGQFIPDPDDPSAVLTTDHAMPAQLRFEGSANETNVALPDPYRIAFPAGSAGKHGIALIIYRRLEDGFDDIVRIDIPLGMIEVPK